MQIKIATKIQATISILENIEIFAEKSTENDFKNELLPIVLNAFDSKNSEIQVSSFMSHDLFVPLRSLAFGLLIRVSCKALDFLV